MSPQSRKEWLLSLWEFHNGGLSEEDHRRVDERITSDADASADSMKVLQIIEELRQAGRWETDPGFPERMIARLLPASEKSPLSKLGWVVAALVILALLFFLLRGGDEEGPAAKEVSVSPAQDPPPTAPTKSPQGRTVFLDDEATRDFFSFFVPNNRSEQIDPNRSRVRESMRLSDHAKEIEAEMDDWFPVDQGLRLITTQISSSTEPSGDN